MNNSFMDRYGYYQIGDFKTYSLHEMMDRYKEDPQPYRWHYNNEFFSQYDWTQEPTESLDELYKQRALELREQYDYIILYYSGGHDSTNMLHAFLDNGIYPDELMVYYSRHDTVSHQYKELKGFTWNKIESLKKKYPKLKIRTFDYSDLICDWSKLIANHNLNIDPLYLFGTRVSVNRLILDTLCEQIDDWKKILKDGKTLCSLHGFDIPRLKYNFKKNYLMHTFLADDVGGLVTPFRQMINIRNRDTLELFYWAPTEICTKIMIKQCHLSNNFFKKITKSCWEKIITMPELGYLDREEKEFCFSLHTHTPYRQVLYPRIFEIDEKFYNNKEKFTLWGNRDHWFFNSNYPGSSEHWAMYRSMFKDDKKHWREFFVDNDISKGLKKIKSKDHIITP